MRKSPTCAGNGPAFKAGISPSTTLVAVQGREFTAERLKEAVAASAKGVPVELLIKNGEIYRTFRIDYGAGPEVSAPRAHRERAGSPERDSRTAAMSALLQT